MKNIYLVIFLSFFITYSRASSIDPFFEGGIKIVRFYPNPASSVINFEFKNVEKGYSLQVYNFLGKRLCNQPIYNNKITVPLENVFRGLYIYQLRDAFGSIIESGRFQVIK